MKLILIASLLILSQSMFCQELVGVPNQPRKVKSDSKKLLRKGHRYYELESGEIQYADKMGNLIGKMVFDRNGLREALWLKEDPADEEFSTLQLRDGSMSFFILLADSTSTRNFDSEIPKSTTEYLNKMYPEANVTPQKILNRQCKVYTRSLRKGISYRDARWKGILLASEFTMNGKTTSREAIEIKEHHTFDESIFEIMKHVTFVYPENN